MGISIKNPDVERMIRQVAQDRGLTLTQAVAYAMRQVLPEQTAVSPAVIERRRKALERFLKRIEGLPVLDDRTADDIIGYDENGLPTQ